MAGTIDRVMFILEILSSAGCWEESFELYSLSKSHRSSWPYQNHIWVVKAGSEMHISTDSSLCWAINRHATCQHTLMSIFDMRSLQSMDCPEHRGVSVLLVRNSPLFAFKCVFWCVCTLFMVKVFATLIFID